MGGGHRSQAADGFPNCVPCRTPSENNFPTAFCRLCQLGKKHVFGRKNRGLGKNQGGQFRNFPILCRDMSELGNYFPIASRSRWQFGGGGVRLVCACACISFSKPGWIHARSPCVPMKSLWICAFVWFCYVARCSWCLYDCYVRPWMWELLYTSLEAFGPTHVYVFVFMQIAFETMFRKMGFF